MDPMPKYYRRKGKEMRKISFTVETVVFLMALVLGMPMSSHAASDTMKVVAIDLGGSNTGEATMVSDASGESILIDSGDNKTRAVFKWLDANGYKKKKFDVVVTHWHDDHAGNTGEIIRRYNIGTVYMPKADYIYEEETPYYKYERLYYKDVVDSSKLKGTKIVYLKKGQTIRTGSVTGKVIYCCGSPRSETKLAVDYINNQSAVIMFSGGGCKFLAAADIEAPAENRLLNSGVSLRADIFKLSHHGLNTSNQQEFLKAVNPTYAYVTSNRTTPSAYMRADIEQSLIRMGRIANVMGTGYNGTVTYTCRDGRVTVGAKKNTGLMYQRLIDKETGKTRKVTCVFNNATRVRKIKQILDSDKYYNQQLNADGTMFSGNLVKRDGNYYLEKNGIGAYNTFARKGGKTYWFDFNGKRKEGGFLSAYGKRYYLNTGDDPYRVCGWKSIDGKKYYFVGSKYEGYSPNTEGMMLTGFKTVIGKDYYFMDSDCSTYKSADSGRLMIGFFRAGGDLYYGANDKVAGFKLADYGAIVKDWATISGRLYYMGPDGAVRTGWQTIDGKRYYMGTNGTTSVKKFVTIDGAVYYFGEDGVMATGLTAIGDATYYFGEDGVMATGFTAVGSEMYYFGEDGRMATGWIELDGRTYYAGEDGRLARGITEIDGKEYTFDEEDCHLIGSGDPLGEGENELSEDENRPGEGEVGQNEEENDPGAEDEPEDPSEGSTGPADPSEGSTEPAEDPSYADTGDTSEHAEEITEEGLTNDPDGSDDDDTALFEDPADEGEEGLSDPEGTAGSDGESLADQEDAAYADTSAEPAEGSVQPAEGSVQPAADSVQPVV